MKAAIYRIEAVHPYRLAIVARPRGNDWLCDELAAISREGIDVLVSMLTPDETRELGLERESDECITASIRFLNLPIKNRAVPSNRDEFLRDVDLIADLLKKGHSVGVHCRASIGRSSLLAASALIRLGWNADKAFELVEAARGYPVPDTPDQRSWVSSNISPAPTGTVTVDRSTYH
jgi:protein-tyrosine phosphatase